MDKLDRIKDAIRYLMVIGEISKQQDIADIMRMNKATVSSALNGNKRYFTNSFIKKFNFAFHCVFNEEWLIDGVGSMLNDCGVQKEIKFNDKSILNTIGNSNVSVGRDNNGQISATDCRKELEEAKLEIKHLKAIIENKDKLLEEKERLINVLMNKSSLHK